MSLRQDNLGNLVERNVLGVRPTVRAGMRELCMLGGSATSSGSSFNRSEGVQVEHKPAHMPLLPINDLVRVRRVKGEGEGEKREVRGEGER